MQNKLGTKENIFTFENQMFGKKSIGAIMFESIFLAEVC